MTATADESDSVHLHGVDLRFPIDAGADAMADFLVSPDVAPGPYVVEIHENELVLFQLDVR